MSDMYAAARGYAAVGWHVLPLWPGTAKPLNVKSNGVKAATTNPGQLRAWWGANPGAGIGIACGPSQLVAIDLDMKNGANGYEAFLAAVDDPDRVAEAFDTFTQETRSGGLHLIYAADPDRPIRSTTGWLDGVDTRGIGGYIAAAPTPGYTVVNRQPPRPVPAWLLDMLPAWRGPDDDIPADPWADADARLDAAGNAPSGGWYAAALTGCLEKIAAAQPGTREATVSATAYRLGRLIAEGGLDEAQVREAAIAAGLSTGLPEAEVRAKVAKGLRDGIARGPR